MGLWRSAGDGRLARSVLAADQWAHRSEAWAMESAADFFEPPPSLLVTLLLPPSPRGSVHCDACHLPPISLPHRSWHTTSTTTLPSLATTKRAFPVEPLRRGEDCVRVVSCRQPPSLLARLRAAIADVRRRPLARPIALARCSVQWGSDDGMVLPNPCTAQVRRCAGFDRVSEPSTLCGTRGGGHPMP